MKVHLIGIGGQAMSALAHLYMERGDLVSGSDLTQTQFTEALAQSGAKVVLGHDPANLDILGGPDLVVTSTAVRDGNPELVAARQRGLKVVHRGRATADIARNYRQVAIAGTNGKTSTTVMVGAVLEPLDPLVICGGRLPGTLFNSRWGTGRYAAIEADESDRSFLELAPDIAVVTNVEADHLDRYRDLDEIRQTFELFASKVSSTLVACVDDPGAASLLAVAPSETLSYGFDGGAEIYGTDYQPGPGGCRFKLGTPWGKAELQLGIPGQHYARNALAAIAVGLRVGRRLDDLLPVMAGFKLPGRRLELVAEFGGARVYDDHAHHPTSIALTLQAAREICQGRLICAMQPLRFSRLKALMGGFAECFRVADEVILVPVYGAGEEPIPGAEPRTLAAEIRRADPDRPVTVLDSLDELPGELRRRLKPQDVAVCMGGGDIWRAGKALADTLAAEGKPDSVDTAKAAAP